MHLGIYSADGQAARGCFLSLVKDGDGDIVVDVHDEYGRVIDSVGFFRVSKLGALEFVRFAVDSEYIATDDDSRIVVSDFNLFGR